MPAISAVKAIRQSSCFACGTSNPHGLGLTFVTATDGSVHANWWPRDVHEGFAGIIHGGIVATVLDEAMSKAVAANVEPGLTCRLEVRLSRSVSTNERLTVRGWVVDRHRRRIQAAAEILDDSGAERASGSATFLVRRGAG